LRLPTDTVAFGGEETGLYGSTHWAATHDLEGVAGQINFDGVGYARDLRVEDRAPGREATLAVTVENGGDAPAPETPVLFTYEVRGEERTAGTATAPPPETGDADDVTVVWDTRGQVGEFPIRAQVDPDDALVEEAEGNNAAESTACFPGADAACQAPEADPVGTVGG
jgi:hypothetical protein